MVLNIISLNVRGLRDSKKRRIIFDFYRNRCHVLCLQETHSTENDEDLWSAEWGKKIIYSHGTNTARGVAILINPKCNAKVVEHKTDNVGRWISLVLYEEEININITTIYAPNSDCPSFFEEIINKIHNTCEKVILVGDYNTVLNSQLDRKNQAVINHKSSLRINQLMEEYHLTDVWRAQNPDSRRYSWYRGTKIDEIQASRLDYALISNGLVDMTHNTFYLKGVLTDHSAFFIGVELKFVERGPSYWKMNTSMLADAESVAKISESIQKTVQETKGCESSTRWELIKANVRETCKQLSRLKANENKVAISQLSEWITEAENRLDVLSEEELQLLNESRIELDALLYDRIKGIMFRSKAKWAIEGKKNTRYFMNLEKARYNSKTCNSLIVDGQPVTNAKEILNQQKAFYQKLYTSDPSVKYVLETSPPQTVPTDFIAAENSELSLSELANAAKSLRNGSCPGCDGLPVEFYKVFWKEVSPHLHAALQESKDNGQLFPSARQGVVNVIPKGNKDTRFLSNLRPITLLNTDYKILEKAIANRMTPALSYVIHDDQRGFLPNRRIAANIRRVLDVICSGEEDNLDCLILSCDYYKCFDVIEIDSIIAAMKKLRFSELLTEWVKIMYTNFMLRIQNNGSFSEELCASRGVHQGGPASNALFLCIAEMLAVNLRSDGRIRGVYAKGVLHFLNQYADDMDLMLENSQENLDQVFRQIEEFKHSSGFRLSYEKTTIYRVGAMRHSQAKLYTKQNVKWAEEINILGVTIVPDEEQQVLINYSGTLNKTEDVLKKWSNRNVSLLGKVNIVNTLVASLFVYKMSVLPTHSSLHKRLHKMVENFLWNGHRPKIPLGILQLPKNMGGAGLVNFDVKDVSLKSTWVRMLMEGQYPDEFVYNVLDPKIYPRSLIWCCNLSENDVDCLFQVNQFWKDVLRAWCKYHYTVELEGDHILWYNSLIRSNNKPIEWKEVAASGLTFVSQLFRGSDFISCEEAQIKFNLDVHRYNILKCAIPKKLKEVARKEEVVFKDNQFAKLMHAEKASRKVYATLAARPTHILDKYEERWCKEFAVDAFDLTGALKRINKVTFIMKLRSFQFRLLLFGIITNIQLFHWKMKDSNLCTFCESKKETYEHLFWSCEKVAPLWAEVMKLLGGMPSEDIEIDYKSVMCNTAHKNAKNTANMLILATKQYIYRQRCLKLTLCRFELVRLIFEYKSIEKYYSVKYNRIACFHKRWNFL